MSGREEPPTGPSTFMNESDLPWQMGKLSLGPPGWQMAGLGFGLGPLAACWPCWEEPGHDGTLGLASLKLLYVRLKLERSNEIGRSEVSAGRSLVVVSDGNIDADTVNLTCLDRCS